MGRWDNVRCVTEDDFESSSLEQPDSQPEPANQGESTDQGAHNDQGEPTDQAGETDLGEPSESEGSTLEKPSDDVVYVKKNSIRRRPKYGVFGVLGGLLGLIVGLVLAQVGTIPAEQDYSRLDLSIVLVGLGVPTGILLALLLALVLDRRKK